MISRNHNHVGGRTPSSTSSSSATGLTPSTQSRQTSDASEISEALKQARREARRLQFHIKLPALITGALLMGGSMWWVLTSWTANAAAFMFVRDLLRSAGCIAWLCACLPSDRWAPKVGCALLFILGVKCAWSHTTIALQYVGQLQTGPPCHVMGKETECWLGAYVIFAQSALYLAMHLWQLPYLARGMWLTPRRTLARQWVALALLHFTKGASDFLVILPAVAIRAARSGTGVPYAVIVFSALHGVYAVWMGFLLQSTRVRQRVYFSLLSLSGALTAASSIAAFIGSRSPKAILQMAEDACRYVSLDRVTKEDMRLSTPDISLQAHSTSCRLQDIDAFLSHSWHDPADSKWDALQAWRCKFKEEHQREPRVWIDKYCIDQANIEASLMCLPVFLAGCHNLVILAGPTYLSRLWCVEEVFVYLQMRRQAKSIELFPLCADLGDLISSFDVEAAQCHLDIDRQKLLATIEAGCDGFEQFNSQVRHALELALQGAAGRP